MSVPECAGAIWGQSSHARAGCSQAFKWFQKFFSPESTWLRIEIHRREQKREELSRHLTDPSGWLQLTQPYRISFWWFTIHFFIPIFSLLDDSCFFYLISVCVHQGIIKRNQLYPPIFLLVLKHNQSNQTHDYQKLGGYDIIFGCQTLQLCHL